MENNVEKKESKSMLIIGSLVVIILMLGGYICFDKLSNNSNSETSVNENNNDSNIQKTQKLGTFDISNFDGSKVINGDQNTSYASQATEVTNAPFNGNLQTALTVEQKDSNNVTINVDWGKLANICCSSEFEQKVYTYNISNNNKIRKVYVSGWGQGIGSETILYLMEDGTIEYTPVTTKTIKDTIASIDTASLKNNGKISNVEGVVMVATVGAGPTDSQAGGYKALIGIKEDGTFYDISKILSETDDYK